MTKAQAGAIGGKTTATKHGKEYMAELARKGAAAMHAKYRLEPINQNDFAIVDRETGKPCPKTLCGVRL